MSKPFARAIAMMAAIAAAMGNQAGLLGIGQYKSRGKGGKRAHTASGTRRNQRAAVKTKNIQRNRLAHR